MPPRFAAFLLFLLTICIANAAAAATFGELETTLQTLRNHGFNLFTNGIATSDIQIQLLSASVFTLFAPRDVQLFTLDMESTAAAYTSTLRYHVIPGRRLTFSDLLNHTSSFLDTLLPHHSVLIGKTQDSGASGVVVDGIRVSVPDLFLGSRFAVHGIDGILATGLIDRDYFNFYEQNNVPAASRPKFVWGIPAATQGKRRGRKNGRHGRHRRHGRHIHYHLDSL